MPPPMPLKQVPAFLAATMQQKRRLPWDLQVLWRLDRGLCPTHGTVLHLIDWLPGEYDPKNPKERLILIGCRKAGCKLRIIARDWNTPAYEQGPYCIESFGDED